MQTRKEYFAKADLFIMASQCEADLSVILLALQTRVTWVRGCQTRKKVFQVSFLPVEHGLLREGKHKQSFNYQKKKAKPVRSSTV